MQSVTIEWLWMEFNSSRIWSSKWNQIKGNGTRYPIRRVTFGKSHGLVPLVMSSIFKYDYLRSNTSLTLMRPTAFVNTSITNNVQYVFIEGYLEISLFGYLSFRIKIFGDILLLSCINPTKRFKSCTFVLVNFNLLP